MTKHILKDSGWKRRWLNKNLPGPIDKIDRTVLYLKIHLETIPRKEKYIDPRGTLNQWISCNL